VLAHRVEVAVEEEEEEVVVVVVVVAAALRADRPWPLA
jgi:hypothetical protein